jgi:hypothetical protein
MSRTLQLAEQLISRPSVTPDDAGCQQILGERLAALGFTLETLESGPADFRVTNLWAVRRPANAARRHQDAGVRRPHRRGAHRPRRAMDQPPLHAHAPRRQALRPRRLRHEDLGGRLRGVHRGIPAGSARTAAHDRPAAHQRRGRPRRRRHRRRVQRAGRARRDRRLLHRRRAHRGGALRRHDQERPPRHHERQAHGEGRAGPHRLPAPGQEPGARRGARAGRAGGHQHGRRLGRGQCLLPADQLADQQLSIRARARAT